MDGAMAASGKMRVGYFTQYQVEELDGADTPLGHMTRVMSGKTPGAVRAQLGRFGFTGNQAVTQVGKPQGGARPRLALALIPRHESGRASCRGSVWRSVELSVVALQ